MKKLAIIILAGTALAGPAVAQTVAPPVPWQDVPAMRLNAPARMAAPAPGVTWQQRGPAVQPVRAATPARAMRPTPQRPPMTHAPAMRPAHGSRPPVVRPPMHRPDRPAVRPNHNQHNYVHRGDNRPVGRGPHHGPRFPHIKPIKHGHVVPQFWFGPRFHIVNWGMYGFSQPFGDQRWIRYYDDAYLIDRGGRVHDSRYGMEWDRYGDSWAYDQSGIPMRGDDGGYVHGYHAEEDYSYGGGYQQQHHAPPPVAAPGGCGGPGYPQPGGYMPAPCGYGAAPAYYGYGYAPMVITETTTVTTTAPTVTEHIYYEESAPPVRRRAARHRPVASDCGNCGPAPARAPAPIPYGEKG